MPHHIHPSIQRLWYMLVLGLFIFASGPAQAQAPWLRPALQQLSNLLERQKLSDSEIEAFFPADDAEDVLLLAFDPPPRADNPYDLFQGQVDQLTPAQARLAAKHGLSFMFPGKTEHFLKQYLAQVNPASVPNPDAQTRFTSQGVNYLFSIRVREDESTVERLVFDIVLNTEVYVEDWGNAESSFFYTFSFEHNVLKLVGMNAAG